MSNQFLKLRRSSVQGKTPTTSSLDFGELAMNTFDGKLFMKKSGSTGGEQVIAIGETSTTFPYTGSATISGSLVVTGSISATSGFTGSLQGTSSWAQNALTASFALNGGVTQIVAGTNITITPSSGLGQVTINSTGGGGTTFPYTGSAQITGSLGVTGSISSTLGFTGSLFGTSSWSQNALTASFITASNVFGPFGSNSILTSSYAITASRAITSSYADLSNIQYVTNSIQTLSQIEVLDYDANVVVDFTGGRLKFIFGAPATQSITSFSFNSTFLTDRFNRVLDDYTASAAWSNGGYTLISASIFEGSTLLAQTGTGTTLTYQTLDSGSHTYVLQVTASNPSDASILVKSASLAGTLSKTNPGNPTITPTATVQLGATSNQIEQGATGSITFTSASGASNGWVLNFVTSSRTSPIFVTGSLTGSASIVIAATASYSSSGVNGSDNSPALVTSSFATSTFTKIRSLRSGATPSASLTQAEIENLGVWDTTIGGSIGTISKGTTTASGQSVTITWTSDKYHYIIYNGSLSFLTNITAAGFGVLSSFTSSSVGEYKVYRTNLLQAGGVTGTTITYALT